MPSKQVGSGKGFVDAPHKGLPPLDRRCLWRRFGVRDLVKRLRRRDLDCTRCLRVRCFKLERAVGIMRDCYNPNILFSKAVIENSIRSNTIPYVYHTICGHVISWYEAAWNVRVYSPLIAFSCASIAALWLPSPHGRCQWGRTAFSAWCNRPVSPPWLRWSDWPVASYMTYRLSNDEGSLKEPNYEGFWYPSFIIFKLLTS